MKRLNWLFVLIMVFAAGIVFEGCMKGGSSRRRPSKKKTTKKKTDEEIVMSQTSSKPKPPALGKENVCGVFDKAGWTVGVSKTKDGKIVTGEKVYNKDKVRAKVILPKSEGGSVKSVVFTVTGPVERLNAVEQVDANVQREQAQ